MPVLAPETSFDIDPSIKNIDIYPSARKGLFHQVLFEAVIRRICDIQLEAGRYHSCPVTGLSVSSS